MAAAEQPRPQPTRERIESEIEKAQQEVDWADGQISYINKSFRTPAMEKIARLREQLEGLQGVEQTIFEGNQTGTGTFQPRALDSITRNPNPNGRTTPKEPFAQ